MSTPSGSRSIGVVVNAAAFDRELAARGLEARDLAKIAGVRPTTLARARRGDRITRATLMLISDALLKIPVHPVAAVLVDQGKEQETNVATTTRIS